MCTGVFAEQDTFIQSQAACSRVRNTCLQQLLPTHYNVAPACILKSLTRTCSNATKGSVVPTT